MSFFTFGRCSGRNNFPGNTLHLNKSQHSKWICARSPRYVHWFARLPFSERNLVTGRGPVPKQRHSTNQIEDFLRITCFKVQFNYSIYLTSVPKIVVIDFSDSVPRPHAPNKPPPLSKSFIFNFNALRFCEALFVFRLCFVVHTILFPLSLSLSFLLPTRARDGAAWGSSLFH